MRYLILHDFNTVCVFGKTVVFAVQCGKTVMPALLERLLPPAPAASVSEPPAPVRTCSGCFLTEARFRETGLLGCARCYETFAPEVALGAEKLHGVRVPGEWQTGATVPVRAASCLTNPWPTRRAVPHP